MISAAHIASLIAAHHSLLFVVGVVCFVTGFLPLIGAEMYLAYTALKIKFLTMVLLVALVASLGQMLAKSIIYFMGAGSERFLPKRQRVKLAEFKQNYTQAGNMYSSVLFMSSLVGLPPFYLINIVCGTLRLPFNIFLVFGFLGTFIRFFVVVLIPGIIIHYL